MPKEASLRFLVLSFSVFFVIYSILDERALELGSDICTSTLLLSSKSILSLNLLASIVFNLSSLFKASAQLAVVLPTLEVYAHGNSTFVDTDFLKSTVSDFLKSTV